MKTPRVSVLIPTYNRADMICEAIDSVLAQSFQDFEIVVIDDGSTDDTRAKLARYGDRIRYEYGPNEGAASARNRGFRAARGEYVCILDSDDQYYPHKLAMQVEHLDTRPDTVMVYSDFSAFDAQGPGEEFHLRSYHASAYRHERTAYAFLFEERWSLNEDAALRAIVAEDPSRAHWLERSGYRGHLFDAYLFDTVVFTNSMMFRRSLLEKIGLQDAYFGHFHDLEFALRLCKAGPVAFLDVPTYKLRYHTGQVSTTAVDGGLNAVRLQRGLLRVARVHGLGDRAYYERNRERVDELVARLCRAAAVPLIAYGGPGEHRRRIFTRRARAYLRWSARHGHAHTALRLVSYLPTIAKRVYFRLQALREQRVRGDAMHAA
jgi:glycosyltransferase involved in cell wall biosynthesis